MRGHVGQQPNLAIKPSVQAIVQPKAGHLKGTWKIMLPMVALITLSGCTGNNQATNEKKGVKEMGNQDLVTQQKQKAPVDTLKPTPVKTEGRGNVLKDTPVKINGRIARLEAKRKEIINENPTWDLPMPERGVILTLEKKAELIVETMYMMKEVAMYDAALKDDQKAVEKTRRDMLDFAASRGETEIGREKVRTFDMLNSP